MSKFVIRKSEKEVISMRIDLKVLKLIDEMANSAQISRNELINQMIMFAINNMEDSEESD